jgi:hypothetical protein
MTDTGPTVDPEGVPNLDAMNDDELLAFVSNHRNGAALDQLFHADVVGQAQAEQATHLLARYALTLRNARLHRLNGDIQLALDGEALAQRIYNQLPKWARW